jgi:cytoskeletal protein RodZ
VLLAAAGVVCAAVLAVYLGVLRDGSPSAGPSHAATAPSKAAASEAPSAAGTPDRAATGVTVKVRAESGRSSWIQVTDASGRTLYDGTLTGGGSRTFADRTKLKLTIGNAGAVRLTVNGRDTGPAGPDGQVLRLVYGPDDPAEP